MQKQQCCMKGAAFKKPGEKSCEIKGEHNKMAEMKLMIIIMALWTIKIYYH